METPAERYINLLRSTQVPGIEDLISYLNSPSSDWFTAPASSKYHGAYAGGLVDHCLAVYDELERIATVYNDKVATARSSRIIVALLHDLCKINTYKPTEKSRKNMFGQWEKYQTWDHDECFKFGGHGSKSVYIAQQYIKLNPAEAAAINCHMATWEEGKQGVISQVFNDNPLAWMLHVADEAATFIDQK
jgi:hypothetical protein